MSEVFKFRFVPTHGVCVPLAPNLNLLRYLEWIRWLSIHPPTQTKSIWVSASFCLFFCAASFEGRQCHSGRAFGSVWGDPVPRRVLTAAQSRWLRPPASAVWCGLATPPPWFRTRCPCSLPLSAPRCHISGTFSHFDCYVFAGALWHKQENVMGGGKGSFVSLKKCRHFPFKRIPPQMGHISGGRLSQSSGMQNKNTFFVAFSLRF